METEKIAFKMKLKPGCVAAYQKRHSEVWPELKALLNQHGISDYAIFFDPETDLLFAVQLRSTEGTSSQDLGATAIMKRWWAYMADLMDTHEDNSPVSSPLVQVFQMD